MAGLFFHQVARVIQRADQVQYLRAVERGDKGAVDGHDGLPRHLVSRILEPVDLGGGTMSSECAQKRSINRWRGFKISPRAMVASRNTAVVGMAEDRALAQASTQRSLALPGKGKRGQTMRLATSFWVAAMVAPIGCNAQSAANLAALNGLAPVSVLPDSPAGQQALAANLAVTGGIQTGAFKQPTLLPFADQQRQALRDAFITGWNASELADGLGTKLGAVYQSKAKYSGPKDFTSISPATAALIAYTNETTAADSNAAKFFFANGTTDGKMPVAAEVAAILKRVDGKTDVFGTAYGRVAGSAGAGAYGDSRPFQTEPTVAPISGPDYFGNASNNMAYLRGPVQDLSNNPSFPSGHTTYGYAQSLVLAILVPERYPQEIARAAEYGNDRIILGAHYAMDVIGGRTLALYDVAHLLANDPHYVGQPKTRSAVIADYRQAVVSARGELAAVLEAGCGGKIAVCAAQDTGRFRDAAANEAFYDATRTYGLPVVYPATAGATENVAKVAPEAGYLLTVAFPYLSLNEADSILAETEGPGGGFLDDGSAFGLYSRLDLFAAGRKAIALAPAR